MSLLDRARRIVLADVNPAALRHARINLIGCVMNTSHWSLDVLWLAPLTFLVIRPAAVAVGLIGTGVPRPRLLLLGAFSPIHRAVHPSTPHFRSHVTECIDHYVSRMSHDSSAQWIMRITPLRCTRTPS